MRDKEELNPLKMICNQTVLPYTAYPCIAYCFPFYIIKRTHGKLTFMLVKTTIRLNKYSGQTTYKQVSLQIVYKLEIALHSYNIH